jgi:hypothetical protein
MPGEQPLPGDLRGGKPPVVDEGVDLLFMDAQVAGHLLGIHEPLVSCHKASSMKRNFRV